MNALEPLQRENEKFSAHILVREPENFYQALKVSLISNSYRTYIVRNKTQNLSV